MSEPADNIMVFGPPGVGKTRWLSERIHDTCKHRGTQAVVVASFTKAAAVEIAGRGLPIPKEQVGTLHSLAYRAIGRPEIANVKVEEWNEQYRYLAMSSHRVAPEDIEMEMPVANAKCPGDALLQRVGVLRARQVPQELWPIEVGDFYAKWVAWCDENSYVDFDMMIERALTDTDTAPGNPEVLVCDEGQDLSPLDLALLMHWGKQAQRVVVACDDDQLLYSFRGCNPQSLVGNAAFPEESRRVLPQSYRIPASVHRVAEAWVHKLSYRAEKEYRPRDEEGRVSFEPNYTYIEPAQMVDRAVKEAEAGRSVFILAACSYMLSPIITQLRNVGMPFCNEYRVNRGDWNPLTPQNGVSASKRLLAYLAIDPDRFGDNAHPWTAGDLKLWTDVMRCSDIMQRGAKMRLSDWEPHEELTWDDLESLFKPEHIDAATSPDVAWFYEHMLAARKASMQFPIDVATRSVDLLVDQPKIQVGTVHSMKGAESQVVMLLPDISYSGYKQWTGAADPLNLTLSPSEASDAVRRQFYVGMTRCSEELIFCGHSGRFYIPSHELMAVV